MLKKLFYGRYCELRELVLNRQIDKECESIVVQTMLLNVKLARMEGATVKEKEIIEVRDMVRSKHSFDWNYERRYLR
jgi:hypothetical protein